ILTGSAAIDGFGNELANVLTGNSGDNVLDGLTGVDLLIGGAGNDTFIVNDEGEVVIEAVGEGVDTIESSLNYALNPNVENLTLTSQAVVGTGNELDNVITGNEMANVLDGGMGADVLIG